MITKILKFLCVGVLVVVCNCGESTSYHPKTINYSGNSYENFNVEATKVFEEYRSEIIEAFNQENWDLVLRELVDYWQLVDGITTKQTGNIWTNERYQESFDNFASKIIIDEAKVLLDKQDEGADDILLELIYTVRPTEWSNVDNSNFSKSSGKSIIQKVTPAIIKLADLKKRKKVIDALSDASN